MRTKLFIRVDAEVSHEFLSAFPQFNAQVHPVQTTLLGDVADQEELQGMLNLLTSLGIPVVEVITIPCA
ncbi:MAG: hypothetical protein ABWX96_19795 [Propionibacteriaceae bacterium]